MISDPNLMYLLGNVVGVLRKAAKEDDSFGEVTVGIENNDVSNFFYIKRKSGLYKISIEKVESSGQRLEI